MLDSNSQLVMTKTP